MKNQPECLPGRAGAASLAVLTLLIGFTSAALADHRYKGWDPAEPLIKANGEQMPGGCPIESPAGNFVFTARNPSGMNLDIYVNERSETGEAFGPGAALPAPINDAGLANDFCPTPLPDNGLYFVSARSADGACGDVDMYRAVQNPATGWSEPENLGCHPHGPNTPGFELSPSVIETRWGTFLFYSTDYHTGNQDIYYSRMRPDGSFGRGIRLRWPINTEYDDRQPNVSQDGREIVFASNRPSSADDETGFDIFTAKRRFLFAPFRHVTNLSESVPFDTVDGGETRPSLSWDGERLYYGTGGKIWISERD